MLRLIEGEGPLGSSWAEATIFPEPPGVPVQLGATDMEAIPSCPICGSKNPTWYFRSLDDVPGSPAGVHCEKCGPMTLRYVLGDGPAGPLDWDDDSYDW